jgi:uroporphyrinogen decarboxylase
VDACAPSFDWPVLPATGLHETTEVEPFWTMVHSIDAVKNTFAHRFAGRILKGELWLGRDLFKRANLEDNLEGHLSLIKRLGQDILCLPLTTAISMNTALGYRYFSVRELAKAARMEDLFVMAIIDGPFQRLVGKKGLMNLLAGWRRWRHEVTKEYRREQVEVDLLIQQCLSLSIDAVVIADDVAGERSLFVVLNDIQDLFSPFYYQAVSAIHSGDSYALFHSCGNIQMLIPHLVSYGFDGLAAIQQRTNDLISIKEQFGSKLTIMAGIEAEALEARKLSLSTVAEFERLVQSLALGGGFILCSSSGLYAGDFLARVQELYRIADGVCTSQARR